LCILCVEQQKSVVFSLEHSLSALIAGNFMDFLSFLGPPKKVDNNQKYKNYL